MKITLKLFAAAFALCLLASCGTADKVNTPVDSSGVQSAVSSSEAAASSAPAEQSASVKLPQYEYYTDDAGYYMATVYSSGQTVRTIADAYGKTVYTPEEDENILLYAGGYFLSQIGDTQYLKKHDGTDVCSTETLGVTGFGLIDDTSENRQFLSDGYVLAYKTNESYSGVTYELGILGTDGEWIIQLSGSNPLLSSGLDCSENTFEEELLYAGEGMLVFEARNSGEYDSHMYNIGSNQVIEFNTGSYISVMDYLAEQAWFENGVSYDMYQSTVYEIHTDGNVSRQEIISEDVVNPTDTYGFHVGDDGTITTLISNGWNRMLVNSKNEILRDFAGINMETGTFDGTAPAIITNNEGSKYYAVIGLDGEFLFEPVKLPDNVVYVLTESGRKVESESGASLTDSGPKLVIDDKGNVLYTSQKEYSDLYISNGVVWEYGETAIPRTEEISEFSYLQK